MNGERIEPELGAEKLLWIETCLEQIRTLAHPEALRTDIREQRFIAYTLQIAMQAAKEAATQIAEAEGRGDQRTGGRAFHLLAKNGWISASLLPRLRILNRLRQTLIHKSDPGVGLIEEALRQAPGILQDFVQAIRPNMHPLADLSALAASLSSLGFGRIDAALAHSFLLATQGTLSETRSAVRRAVAFLRDSAQVPHVSLLSSTDTLLILSVFFDRHPSPSPRTERLLTRWVWRWAAAVAAHEGEGTSPNLEARVIVPESEDASVRALLAGLPSSQREWMKDLAFDLSSARTKLHLAALAALRPRDATTGEVLDVAALCDRPGGPASPLVPGSASLASRILHPGEGDLRAKLTETDDPEVLRSHLLSANSQVALRREDVPAFLNSRAQDLQAYLLSFLQAKADWDATDRDRPALSSLIVTDE